MPGINGWKAIVMNGSMAARGQFVCPHCGFHATFTGLASGIHGTRVFEVISCDSADCGRLVYVEADHLAWPASVGDYYPKTKVPKPHEAIPKAIAADWVEAQNDLANGAIASAALMCRRVLYGVLLQQNCKEHPLHEGLKELADKTGLPQLLRQKLDEIKDDGHDAAHPSRALELSSENVEETVSYTEDLLKWVYEEPWRLQQRYARKAAPPGAGTGH